jgi:acyl-CoA reductase-like NAD-dependent aldehyde dehydrogenase
MPRNLHSDLDDVAIGMTMSHVPFVTSFVEGASVESESDERIDVINPSSGRRCASIPVGCAADADRAVTVARRAFDDGRWSDLSPLRRKETMRRFADLITADAVVLDRLDATEMGKPVGETFGNAAAAAELLRFYGESVDKVTGDVFGSDSRSLVLQRRVPRGVIAAVVPWNFPTYVAVLKLAPALAAGNCVVLKPSELSSRSAVHLAQLAIQAGVPIGVLNVILGSGETVGRALGLHMNVDMLTFTGSTSVGKLMMQYAGQSNMKALVTECGGKSPQIVFASVADLDAASDAIARRLLTNQGQVCSVGSRLLVERSIEAALVERITATFRKAVIGSALEPQTTFGPLASAKQYSRVAKYIELGQAQGAHLVEGGRRLLVESGGYFVEPTLFQGVSPQACIAQEEIFGPVLSVISFEDEADALRIANNTMYGLAAYVWTDNLSTGIRIAKGIRSSVFVQSSAAAGEGSGHAASCEPFKQSGIGVEGGLAGMETFLQRQLIMFSHA